MIYNGNFNTIVNILILGREKGKDVLLYQVIIILNRNQQLEI